jgi:hypothetical protein
MRLPPHQKNALDVALKRWSAEHEGAAPAKLDDAGKAELITELSKAPGLAGVSKVALLDELQASVFEAKAEALADFAGGARGSSGEQVHSISTNTVLGARLPKQQQVLVTEAEVLDFAARFDDGVLLAGFGSKNQFKDPAAVLSRADQLIADMNAAHGPGKWFAAFGGDPLNEDKPDIAIVAKHLADRGVPVLATQSDVVVNEWDSPVDAHIPFVHYVPTDKDAEGKVQWGGRGEDGALLGASKMYLGPLAEHLGGVALFGGGDIAAEEAEIAREKGMKIINCPVEARFPTGDPLGASARFLE